MSTKTERPKMITDDHLTYLDDLRESGETNMYGAAPYVQEEFGVSRDAARSILSYWMATYSDRHPSS